MRQDLGRLVKVGGLALVGVVLLLAGAASAGLAPWQLLPGAPDNDSFDGATAVAGERMVGTTESASADSEEVAAGVGTSGQAVVWYVWSAPVSGWAYITPAAADGGPVPEVRAYTGDTLDSLTRVDIPPDGGTGGATIPAAMNTSYKLAVIADSAFDFDLLITQPFAALRVNDEPDGAVDVIAAVEAASTSGASELIVADTLAGATAAVGEPAVGGIPAEHSLWYSWTPLVSGGSATFTAEPIAGATGPFRIAIYEAAESDGEPGLSVADLVPSADVSGTTVTPVAGTSYLISVDGPAEFHELRVTATGVASSTDTTPPVVTCDPAPTGWSNAERIEISCTASDAGSGLAHPDDAAFVLGADTTDGAEADDLQTGSRPVCDIDGNCAEAGPVTGLRSDRAAPEVTCTPLVTTWTSDAPSVTCTSTDGGSGLADPADAERTFAEPVPPDHEGELTVAGGTVCDAAGNCTEVGPFGPTSVDRRPPEVSCTTTATGPRTEEVVYSCTAADAGSGLTDPSDAEFELTTSVGEGRADDDASTDHREVCDLAGNCTTAGPIGGLVVDRSPPSVECVPDDGRPTDEWRDGPFTFTCTVSEVGTGLTASAPSTVTLEATLGEGEASDSVVATSTGVTEVCDLAGNCVPVGDIGGLRIDRQAPLVACPEAGDGWVSGTATVTCTVVDGEGAGLDGAATVTLTAMAPAGEEGTYDTDSVEVCDLVGNCTTAGPVEGVRIDHKAPEISCEPPAAGYVTEARITCRGADGGSGLADGGDAEFSLVTSVGEGNADPAAQTDSRTVCDVAGNCAAAGPVTVSVDRTQPLAEGPRIEVPSRVNVLSTFDPIGPTPVPYDLPTVPGGANVACRPAPGTTFGLGWTTVSCEAVGSLGISLGSFPLLVKPVPELAPGGIATAGGAWRAVGVGFAPGSSVSIRIGADEIATAAAGGDGRVSAVVTVPSDLPSGDHLLVIVGRDGAGDPLYVVGPLSSVAPGPGDQPSDEVPDDAPVLPPSGPEVPGDPGPPPAAPDLGDISPATTIPPETTTTTTLPGVTPTDPGGPTPTNPDGTPVDPDDQAAPGGQGDGSDGGGTRKVFGTLPVTGATVGGFLVLAAILIAAGVLLRRAGSRP